MTVDSPEQFDFLRAMHSHALNYEVAGNFDAAHNGFAELLGGLDRMDITPNNLVLSTVLRADALRDDSFTSLRNGLRSNNPGLIDGAESGLQEARAVTSPYISGDEALPDKQASSEIFTAHAKTEGCLGRLVVARQLINDEITLEAPATDQQIEEQHWFDLAYKHALGGNSAYTGASISITSARTEIINGSSPSSLALAKRSGIFVFGHLDQGLRPKDRIDATLTLLNHSRDLKDRETAMWAATNWRIV